MPAEILIRARRTHRIVAKAQEIPQFAGSCVGITGPNGAGKTAFLKAACGFGPFELLPRLEPRPKFVYLDNEPLAGVEHWLPAIEVLRLFCRSSLRSAEHLLHTAPDELGVPTELVHSIRDGALISELSSGQRQMLMMVAAFYTKARLWVLDECMSALDQLQVQTALKVIEKVAETLTHDGGAIVVTGHDFALFQRLIAACGRAGLRPEYWSCSEGVIVRADVPADGTPLSEAAFNSLYAPRSVAAT